MRTTRVDISCDNCFEHIVEGSEVPVTVVMADREYDSDWCQPCAEALEHKLNPADPEITCACGYVPPSGKPQGLAMHKRRTGHA